MNLPGIRRFLSDTGVRIYRIPCDVLPGISGRVYLVLGAGVPTLVDSGSGEGQSNSQLLAGVDTVRHEFGEAIQPADIRRILITHAHVDHIGGLAELVRRTNAQVGVHALDRRVIEAWDERSVVYNRALLNFFQAAGVDPERHSGLLDTFGYHPHRVQNVPVAFTLEDGQQLDGLEIIHVPGHSPGHVAIRIGDILLCGDHILARTMPQQWPEQLAPYTGLGHYLDSLERIRRIEGLTVGLGGHEPAIRELYSRVDEIRSSHLRRLERLMDIIAKAPRPLSIDEMSRHMYSRQLGFYALLTLIDVGARVEYLDQHGRLAIANLDEVGDQEHPVYRYRPASTSGGH
jgi:glyoxylase-like metal-dependent hydrolase (beta-lactamase superfamily II)